VASSAFAAIFLEIINQLFTWHSENLTSYDVIFGSMAAVVILVVAYITMP
jgi:uncharacterized BrkB/YihY/UPF0761 family membrane protein